MISDMDQEFVKATLNNHREQEQLNDILSVPIVTNAETDVRNSETNSACGVGIGRETDIHNLFPDLPCDKYHMGDAEDLAPNIIASLPQPLTKRTSVNSLERLERSVRRTDRKIQCANRNLRFIRNQTTSLRSNEQMNKEFIERVENRMHFIMCIILIFAVLPVVVRIFFNH